VSDRGSADRWYVAGVALAILAACGSTPMVRMTGASGQGVFIYVSGFNDQSQRTQFEDAMRGNGDTVSEVQSIPSSETKGCEFSLKGYRIQITSDSSTDQFAVSVICGAVQNQGLPGLQ
jgi:hypothetical protein